MKGLMLFFIMFGLFATLGNDNDKPAIIEETPVIEEQQPVVEQPVAEQPAVSNLSDPVIDKDAVYTAEIEKIMEIGQEREIPLYVKGGFIYYYTQEWNGEAYDLCLTKASVNSGVKSDEVVLFRNDPSSISTNYVYPMKNGGYIGMGSSWGWDDDANYSEYLIKYDASGKMIDKKNVVETYPVDFNSTYFDKVSSDGSNLYVLYEGLDDDYNQFGGVLMFDENLNYVKDVVGSFGACYCVGNDGLVYSIDGYRDELSVYNPKDDSTQLLGTDIPFTYYMYAGQGNEVLYGFDKLYSYNARTRETVELFSFEDLGINLEICDTIYRDSDGNIVVLYACYTEPNTGIFKAVIKASK